MTPFPKHINGVDFSGAQDAGRKIWIAKCKVEGGTLLIEDCFRARDLLNSGNELNRCLPALREFIKQNRGAAFGLDFPFGVPKDLVTQKNWKEFILTFRSVFNSPETFQKECTSNALRITSGHRKELKRRTDKEAKTPYSPYNLRISKQTYYGITEILYPLVHESLASLLPMEKPLKGKPWVIEICPASTLVTLNLHHLSYKGGTDQHGDARRQILEKIVKVGKLRVHLPTNYGAIIEDRGGDALDSVIAAFATFRALKNHVKPSDEWKDFWSIEGYVYV